MGGSVLGRNVAPASIVERARVLVDAYSIAHAGRLLGVERSVLARVVGALPVRHGSVLAVQEGLDRLAAQGGPTAPHGGHRSHEPRCSHCGERGHNVRTCKRLPVLRTPLVSTREKIPPHEERAERRERTEREAKR
jgi:hypothetical protein